MRRAARTDRNHSEIIAALRTVGAFVVDLSRVGEGCPDLLVQFRGRWRLMEVKDGKKPPSKRQLTKTQRDWHAQQLADVHVVTSVEEAVTVLLADKTSGFQALGDH